MMLICSVPYRFWSIKSRRRSSFFIQFCIVFFICIFLFDRIILQSHYFKRKNVIVQTDLLDYNEDKLRSDWPFQIDKHYDVNDLQTYYPKPKIIAKADLPGERGTPVILSPVLQDLAQMSFGEYQLNLVASDRVASNRSLPDLRDPKCLDIKYPKLLPTATVIMVVHNEAWSVLLRAIWSVLNRSPDNLLEELIIVDDFSDKPHLKEPFDEYMVNAPSKLKLVRLEKREGLIRARVIGAENAKGQVLIFLDANTESNDGWLEPLLARIAADRSVVAIPHVDNINISTMAYEEYDEGLIYGLGWNLYYIVHPIPDREIHRNHGDMTAPYRTPALIGCAIAIDREFFIEIGSFDIGMDIWGGENTELSLRVWQCGGAMEIVPCSRVGHFFRTLPYSFNADHDEIKFRNNIRTAEIWMDEYKAYFDAIIPIHLKKLNIGDLSERVALRNKLRCKGFHWYLKNVFPESMMLTGYKHLGQVQLADTKYCIDRLGRRENRQIGIFKCHGHGYHQGFSYQKNQQIVFHHSLCLSIAEKENFTEPIDETALLNDPQMLTRDMNTTNHVVLLNCNVNNGTKWSYDEEKNHIVHIESGLCLAAKLWMVVVAPCNLDDAKQKWIFSTFDEYKRKMFLKLKSKVDSENS